MKRVGRQPSPLRTRRLVRGLRLRDVELATGIGDVVLSRLERGELPLRGRRLQLLAHFYATSPSVLNAEMQDYLARDLPLERDL